MTRDQKTLRSMLVGMALIIGFSATMHVYLLKKKAIRAHRYEPQYGQDQKGKQATPEESLLQEGGTVSGEVIAASYDKFFLRMNDKVQGFGVGELKMPAVGDTVTVVFEGGKTPTATQITPTGSLPRGEESKL